MRALPALVILVTLACGDDSSPGGDGSSAGDGSTGADGAVPGDGVPAPDGPPGGGDGPGLTIDGGSGGCVTESIIIGTNAASSCAFEMPIRFDPGRINVLLAGGGPPQVVCHTLRETGCTGEGWYWSYEHQVTLCDASCDELLLGGTYSELVVELGCPGEGCGSGGCTSSGGYCSYTANSCCSGRCDGDSCGSGLWGPCSGAFDCFSGTCQEGWCRCPPGDLQCGARCYDPANDPQNCGACGRVCTGGQTCQGGDCRCPDDLTWCPATGTCEDLASDESNCGVCGRVCRSDQECRGSCQCPSPLQDCGGACVPLNDLANCGSCGYACDAATEVCVTGGIGSSYYCVCRIGFFDCGGDGVCEDLQSDEDHCGVCFRDCPGMQQCVAGDC